MGAFFHELVVCAAEHGLVVVATAFRPDEHEAAFRSLIDSGTVDGFVLSEVVEQDPRVTWLLDNQVPFAAFGRAELSRPYACVDLDIRAGMRDVTAHVIEAGHSRFAFVGWDGQPTNRFRLEGAHDALAAAGLELDPDRTIETSFSVEAGERAGFELLGGRQAPTAIICSHDILAAGVVRAATVLGRPVGTDLVVSGFDDTPLAQTTTPPLTSVRFPLDEVARQLVARFAERVEGIEPMSTTLLRPELVIRASTSPDEAGRREP